MFVYKVKEFLIRFRIIILVILLLFLSFGVYLIYKHYKVDSQVLEDIILEDLNKENIIIDKVDVSIDTDLDIESIQNNLLYKVDIKGEVKKPGVYELEKDSRVIDVINKAGGLTSNADTKVTNLSKIIFDEMVIIIYSKEEVKNFSETKKNENIINNECNSIPNDSCITNDNTKEENAFNKISINTATKEELMTISGIGESKAIAIIEYRQDNLFKTIEDIMNVSGIGESLFEKIKDYIKI